MAAGLAWAWLLQPADMMLGSPWSAAYLLAAAAMWVLMMVAMMLPSASPMILLYARFARARLGGRAGAGITVFALAYLLVWTAFAVAAALLQAVLVAAGTIDMMGLAAVDRRAAGALLIGAGLYQLTPVKTACLDRCRSPLAFLASGVRPGLVGALRLGLAHGFYCLGCCWALMLLLFAGGVMNLAWVAGLAILVALEKWLPWPIVRKGVAIVLVAGGVALTLGG